MEKDALAVSAKRELAKRELARRYYRHYLYYVYGAAWKKTRMSDFLADKVQSFLETKTGNAHDILVIETPPQHGKSMTITESLPSWVLGKFPSWRIIEVSYNDDTARKFGRKNLMKVETAGRALWGLAKGKVWGVEEFEPLNAENRAVSGGSMISRGIGAGITGNPANLLIIDDPIKNWAEAGSQARRDFLGEEFFFTLMSRVHPGGKVVLIMTPWHEDDLAHRIINTSANAELIRLPVVAEEGDLLGRKPGKPLCPELGRDAAWVEGQKQEYMADPGKGGMRAWSALYQCAPRVEGGNLIHRDWWKRYSAPPSNGYGTTIVSVDAAFKGKENNDFVSIQVWSKSFSYYYLRHGVNKHLTFSETVAEIARIKKLFPEAAYTVIEDKANGSAIIDVLQKRWTGVVGITPKGGKESRLNAVQAAIESGNVFLPEGISREQDVFVEEFIDQFAAFPSGKHDDMVDACTQALNFLLYRYGGAITGLDAEAAERRRLSAESAELAITDNETLYNPYGGGFAGIGGYSGGYDDAWGGGLY